MGLAVAVIDHREPGRGPGGVLLGLEEALFVGLTDLGGHDVQDPSAQDEQLFGVVVAGQPDQVVASPLDQFGVDQIIGKRVERVDDHRGLVGEQVAGGQGITDRFVAAVQGVG